MELKTGAIESTLDDKGRVNIPIRFREDYQGELVIAYGKEHCAEIRTSGDWENFARKTREYMENVNDEVRDYLENKYLNTALPAELDKTGRIAIPSAIRGYANLSKDCIVIRAEDRLSVWDREVFAAYIAEKENLAREAINNLSARNVKDSGRDGN
jgi:MraZ protein